MLGQGRSRVQSFSFHFFTRVKYGGMAQQQHRRHSLVVRRMLLSDQLQVYLLQRRLADDVVQHAQLRRE